LRSKERNPLYFCRISKTMLKLLIIPLLLIGLQATGQTDTTNRTDSKGRKTGYWISTDPSGAKVYEGYFLEGNPIGRFTRFHPNGKTRAEMNYLSDGKRVEARLFDKTGILRAEGIYNQKLKDGPWSFFSEKKLPIYKINYRMGKVHGEALRFDAAGSLMEQTHWNNNVLNGMQTIFFPNKRPQAKIFYKDGKIDGRYELYFNDGSLEVTGNYTSGLKTGTWTYFQSNGQTDYILNYVNGVLINPEVLDSRQRKSFEEYEKNRTRLKDPQDFINNPDELLIR
jgi:antitoxin component YwqK of YwqJK toxin-antitoxin module